MSTAASGIRHALGAGLEALILVAIVAALAFGVALAAGHPAGAGSVFAGNPKNSDSWVQVDQPLAPNTALTYGSTFNALYGTKASYPWALAQCWSNSSTIVNPDSPPASQPMWGEYRSSFGDGSHIGTFDVIDPNGHWLGGGADCTITLMYQQGNRWVTLATNTFTVAP
jgi:hypothetical protein